MIAKFMSKMLLALEPVVKLIDYLFTIRASIKKITGDHYYLWNNDFKAGMVFLTDTKGAGSNIVNPSTIRHGAIYFGTGLRSAIEALITECETDDLLEEAYRLETILDKYKIHDDICYVIEAVGSGVKPTNLVKFMTTKDLFKAFIPNFCDEMAMRQASLNSLHDLGLPYDFAFTDRNKAKYCFEVAANAYEMLGINKLKKHMFKLFGIELYACFTSDTFDKDVINWKCTIDSNKQL